MLLFLVAITLAYQSVFYPAILIPKHTPAFSLDQRRYVVALYLWREGSGRFFGMYPAMGVALYRRG